MFDIINKEAINLDKVQRGDIFIKFASDWAGRGIVVGQAITNYIKRVWELDYWKYPGTSMLSHAALYTGEGMIAEAVGSGVKQNSVVSGANQQEVYHVFHCKDREVAFLAEECSKGVVNKAEYDLLSALFAFGRFDDLFRDDITKSMKEKMEKGEHVKFFCSEFVTYCYNVACDAKGKPRFFNLPQNMITPSILYEQVKGNSEFTHVGLLGAR